MDESNSETTFTPVQRSLPTVEEMERFFLSGVVGTKELRGWLERIDPDFKAIRDADVDAEIQRLAQIRQEQLSRRPRDEEEDAEDEPPVILTREGEEVQQQP